MLRWWCRVTVMDAAAVRAFDWSNDTATDTVGPWWHSLYFVIVPQQLKNTHKDCFLFLSNRKQTDQMEGIFNVTALFVFFFLQFNVWPPPCRSDVCAEECFHNIAWKQKMWKPILVQYSTFTSVETWSFQCMHTYVQSGCKVQEVKWTLLFDWKNAN